jgi:hypothetical protein
VHMPSRGAHLAPHDPPDSAPDTNRLCRLSTSGASGNATQQPDSCNSRTS